MKKEGAEKVTAGNAETDRIDRPPESSLHPDGETASAFVESGRVCGYSLPMPEYKIIELEFGSAEEGEVNCRPRLGGLLRYYIRMRHDLDDSSFWTPRGRGPPALGWMQAQKRP